MQQSSRLSCDKRCKGRETEWLGNWGWDIRSSQQLSQLDLCQLIIRPRHLGTHD